jgi:hypothetical protein
LLGYERITGLKETGFTKGLLPKPLSNRVKNRLNKGESDANQEG